MPQYHCPARDLFKRSGASRPVSRYGVSSRDAAGTLPAVTTYPLLESP
jgi:hypothetical protein